MSNSRRSFCKNAVYLGIGVSFLPLVTYAKANNQANGNKVLSLKKKAAKVVNVYGRICYEDLKPVKNALLEIWHNNSENDPQKFDYEGKLITDSEGNYTFETDFPENHFEEGHYRMSRIFFKIKEENGKELLTKLYFGASGKAFVDGFHVGNTHEKLREELPKTKIENENFSKIQFNIYLNY
jgi:protocatechuate 3,4-dioxygenase beta subunit